jgi:hypothetical protein
LDEAVFDLYGLNTEDRVVVKDGLYRASWQWQPGREDSVLQADIEQDLRPYADVFLSVVTGWLSVRNKRHMRAEIFRVAPGEALRVIRFVLEDGRDAPKVDVAEPGVGLNELLSRIGKRLNVRLTTALTGMRELRIHARNEVIVIKPASRRHWMASAALEDADAVIRESFTRGEP